MARPPCNGTAALQANLPHKPAARQIIAVFADVPETRKLQHCLTSPTSASSLMRPEAASKRPEVVPVLPSHREAGIYSNVHRTSIASRHGARHSIGRNTCRKL